MIEDEGVDITSINHEGNVPLVTSIYSTNFGRRMPCGNTSKYLIPLVDVNSQNSWGLTALMAAVQLMDHPNDFQPISEMLINHSADPNIQDNEGNTALISVQWSVSLLHLELIVIFGENEAQISLDVLLKARFQLA